jgi:hypothetical protein
LHLRRILLDAAAGCRFIDSLETSTRTCSGGFQRNFELFPIAPISRLRCLTGRPFLGNSLVSCAFDKFTVPLSSENTVISKRVFGIEGTRHGVGFAEAPGGGDGGNRDISFLLV